MWRIIIGHIAITFSIRIELLHDQTWSSDHNCEHDRYTMKPRLQLTFDIVVLLVESDDREVIKTKPSGALKHAFSDATFLQ